MADTEYHKIHVPFKRQTDRQQPGFGKLILGQWARDEFELLAGHMWHWTEKIDGANLRVIWNGHTVTFGGCTADTTLSVATVEWLQERFPAELMENQFHDSPAVLYGELVGPKAAAGAERYRPERDVLFFDARVGQWWLRWHDFHILAAQMHLSTAPLVAFDTVHWALDHVGSKPRSELGDFPMQGLVGRPPLGLLGRDGDRLLMKIKARDLA